MILMRFNSYSELFNYLNKENCYENFIIEEIEKYIIQDNNIFIEDQNIEPAKLVDLNIKGRRFCFGVTSMNIRKGEIKHYYWIYER